MVSMPIPDTNSRQAYSDLRSPIAGYDNLGEIVDAMPTTAVRSGDGAHLDPDLDPDVIARSAGWRALFGQTSQAQSSAISLSTLGGSVKSKSAEGAFNGCAVHPNST